MGVVVWPLACGLGPQPADSGVSGHPSAAAEIFAASVALNKLLHLGYVTSELGLSYPQPIMLEVDNATAITFLKDQVRRSKLRHLDCRQAWVEALRDERMRASFS